jgi:hypothetical protein
MIAMQNGVEVYLLYSPRNDREYSFFEIVNDKIPLELSDSEPVGFWGIGGGLEIVINGYCSIFRSTDFNHLVKATSFLIHSMYWIKGRDSDWFDADDTYPDDVVLRTTNKNMLRLKSNDQETLVLSYTAVENTYQKKRGNKFFNDIILSKEYWLAACEQALREYFEVLHKVVEFSPTNETAKIMMNYYKVFENAL